MVKGRGFEGSQYPYSYPYPSYPCLKPLLITKDGWKGRHLFTHYYLTKRSSFGGLTFNMEPKTWFRISPVRYLCVPLSLETINTAWSEGTDFLHSSSHFKINSSSSRTKPTTNVFCISSADHNEFSISLTVAFTQKCFFTGWLRHPVVDVAL